MIILIREQGTGNREQGTDRYLFIKHLIGFSPITHYPLPITHYPLPITHYPLPITHYPLPITHY
ncbi:hypothetical protein IQ228_12990, partial [Dolichospermum sp. LEGE 00246]|nr:hypothetical protein [Dolichospermum sp. LEGE 00246]